MKEFKNMVREASYEAGATVQIKAFELIESRRNRTIGAGGLALLALLAASAPAVAQGCLKGGQDKAAEALTGFIDGAAKFMIFIGGAAAVLMFAVGGFMFIVGGTSDKVRRGKDFIKNAIIGLIILVAGLLIKFVVVNLVAGISSGSSGEKCLDDDGGKGF